MLEIRTYNINDTILSVTPLNNEEIDVLNNYGISNYITFDGLGINLLDESKKFYEETDYKGLRSSLSNENKEIDGYDGGVEILFGVNHTADLPITLIFSNDNCTELRIEHTTATGGMKGHTQKVNGNIVTLYLDTTPYRWLIYPTKTKNEQERVILESVIDGTVNKFNKFKSHNLIEEINVLSDDLPINQFQATVVNPEHLPLNKKTPLTLLSNGKYYGTFYIVDSKRVNKNFYEIKSQNSIGILENKEFDVWYLDQGYPLSNQNNGFIEEIKKLSNVTIIPDFDGNTINIDGYQTQLFATSMFARGYVPIKSCRYALCAVAFAFGLMVDASRSQDIFLRNIPTEISSKILTSDRRILGDAVFNKSDAITTVKIQKCDGFEPQNIITKTYDKGGKYYFDEPPIVYVNTDSNVTNLIWNANYVSFESDTQTTLSIGPAKTNLNIYYIINPNIENESKKELNLTHFELSGYTKDFEFDPITRDLDVLKYIQSRGKVNAKIRLRGEKVGDLIQIETAWDGIITGIITKMDITFGYEDIANIEVLEWNL